MASKMARKDYLNLMAVARIYLFIQLFITPLLLGIFDQSGLSKVIESELYFPLATSFSERSVEISMLAYVGFLCGSLIRLPVLARETTDIDWYSPHIVRMFWVIFLLGYPVKFARMVIDGNFETGGAYFSLFGDVAAFFMMLNWLHLLALPFLAIAYYENQKENRPIARYYPLVLLCYLVDGVLNASTFSLVFPMAIHLAISQRYRPISGFKMSALVLFLLIMIYIKNLMKLAVVGEQLDQLSFYAPLTFLINRVSVSFIISAIVDNPTFTYGYGFFEQFMYAFRVPTYSYAIPDGNLFGRFYSIIDSHDYLTNVAISIVGDLVLHLSTVGVVLGMFVIGVLYRWVSSLSEVQDKLSWIIYAMLWPIMLHGLESPVSILCGTVMRMVLLCVIYYYVGRFFLVPSVKQYTSNICAREGR